jgi:hypothetical protein
MKENVIIFCTFYFLSPLTLHLLPLVMLPNFFIIGVAKAGTTSVQQYLKQHPEVYLPPIKETNYFAVPDLDIEHMRRDVRYGLKVDVDAYIRGGMKKELHNALVKDWEQYRALFSGAKEVKAVGEICPTYLMVPGSLDRIREKLPEAKIVAILRHPVERAFSAYMMFLRDGKTLSHHFAEEALIDYESERKGWGVSLCYLDEGFYAEKLKHLYSLFPEEQVKIYLYEKDLRERPEFFLQDLFSFLGVNPDFQPDQSQEFNVKGTPRYPWLNYMAAQLGFVRQFARRHLPEGFKKRLMNQLYQREGLPRLSEDDRKRLMPLFKEDIRETEKLLGRETGWE